MVVEAVVLQSVEIVPSVEDELANVWRPVQLLGLARLRSAVIVPLVVTGFVPPSVRVEFGVERPTDVTVPLVELHALPVVVKRPFVDASTQSPFVRALSTTFELVAVPFTVRPVAALPPPMVEDAVERMPLVIVEGLLLVVVSVRPPEELMLKLA